MKEKIAENVIKNITIILTSLVVISHDKNVFGVSLGELVELKIGNIVLISIGWSKALNKPKLLNSIHDLTSPASSDYLPSKCCGTKFKLTLPTKSKFGKFLCKFKLMIIKSVI